MQVVSTLLHGIYVIEAFDPSGVLNTDVISVEKWVSFVTYKQIDVPVKVGYCKVINFGSFLNF